ncbi:MAG: S-layer homology domain-containing protein [Candidatus Riflebacteria bacterium]|nr:S-layer homology domain-containing protein [Candidatus Riflebacteria bacterium]
MNFQNTRKFLIAMILLSSALLFSAFSYESPKDFLNRYDLAMMLEDILANIQIPVSSSLDCCFNDLDTNRQQAIARVLSLKIMSGYPDGSFRPEEPMRNLETVCYLQKLARHLRKHRSDKYETRQLMRAFAYQSQPENILVAKLPAGSFPADFAEPGGFIEKTVFEDLLNKLLSNSGRQSYSLKGQVIDAVSGKGISGAYVAGSYHTAVTDGKGKFSIEFINTDNPRVDLFVAAEGFLTLELKKDLRLNSTAILRLKSEKKLKKAEES